MTRWEYERWLLPPDRENEILDRLGHEGWELCAVERGLGYFKRDRRARQLEEQGDAQAVGEPPR